MNKNRLAEEIRFELQQLQAIAQVSRELASVNEKERRPWHAAAAAKYISDIIAGLENLCKRRNKALGKPIPEGPNSHNQILEDFLKDKTLGGKLLEDLAFRLKKYLRFRHRFIHGYGHEINWAIIEEPLRQLPETIKILCDIWENWLKETGF